MLHDSTPSGLLLVEHDPKSLRQLSQSGYLLLELCPNMLVIVEKQYWWLFSSTLQEHDIIDVLIKSVSG